MPMLKKTALAAAITLGLGVGAAQAAPVPVTGVFTMYDGTGGVVGVDNTVTGFFDHATMTFGVSSTTAFFGQQWTASGGTLYAPGTYTTSTTDTGGASGPDVTWVVPTGMAGGNIKFAWGTTTGIDVFMVWDATGTSLDVAGCTGAGCAPTTNGIRGFGMVDGPFQGFSANFDLTPSPAPIPLPAAVWLFGSGLLGLVGIARRRKASVAA